MRTVCLLALLLATPAMARPNITLILADDIGPADLEFMPKTSALLGGAVVMDQAFTNFPLCTPSRCTLMTGLLPRQHLVRTNDMTLCDASSGLAPRLHYVYKTGFFGKYGNKLPDSINGAPPPGWNQFEALVPNTQYGRDQSDVLLGKVQAFQATSQAPWFVMVAPFAAHSPLAGPYRCDLGAAPPISDQQYDWLKVAWKHRHSALCGLDDLVSTLVMNRAPGDWVIFASDNGWQWPWSDNGRLGKAELTAGAAKIIMTVWGPTAVPGVRSELVSMVDLTSTILRAAQIGRSGLSGHQFLPLIENSPDPWISTLEIESAQVVP